MRETGRRQPSGQEAGSGREYACWRLYVCRRVAGDVGREGGGRRDRYQGVEAHECTKCTEGICREACVVEMGVLRVTSMQTYSSLRGGAAQKRQTLTMLRLES